MKNTVPIQFLHDKLLIDRETGVITWKWGARAGVRAGHESKDGYRSIKLQGTLILEHRIVWAMIHGEWPDGEIDHINRNRNDNSPSNLRVVSHSQNHMNRGRGRNNALGVKGVCRNGSGFRAQLRANGKQVYLGTYRTIEDAAKAYADASIKHYGEHACCG